ncbi:hypothetical protein CAP35_03685 [Chitinophagaceae bacterium IBVUCB1]|nr:hypothetical protein CAP35_03685 [Chitinophagaceae bacterium IBVUCB1]
MHAYCMAKGLVYNGVKVSVVTSMDYADDATIQDFLKNLTNGLFVYSIKRNGVLTYITRISKILSLCRHNHFEKIILTGRFSLWLGLLLKVLFGKKITTIAFVHGSELQMGNALLRWLTKKSLNTADRCIAVSNYTKSQTEKSGVNRNIEVIPNGIDISDWEINTTIQSLDWQGYPKLLTVGSITQRKGQHNIINALPLIKKQYPDVHYHVVGKEDDKHRILKLADSLQVQDSITIHGKQNNEDLKRAYKSADIFCMLSEATDAGDVEGFGIAVLEANISGIPAIGSKNTGLEDAIEDGETGTLIEANNPDNLLNAINSLLHTDKTILAKNCREWAMQHDWNTLAKQMI